MRLGELLADPALRLRPLAGGLDPDPEFRWIYITDLRDPRRYLGGGEVVLTGMLWYHGPDDAEAFVSSVAEMGIVALGIGTAEIAPVPVDVVVDACERHRVRLFEVPLDVSFATITERVVSGLAAEHVRRASAVLDHHRKLVGAVAAGGGLAGLLAVGAVELGAPCWVLTPTGRAVAGPSTALHDAFLAREFLVTPRLPARVVAPDGEVYTVLGTGTGHRLSTWALVVAGDELSWPPERHEVASELATLIGLERSALAAGRVVEARTAPQLLRLSSDESTPASEITSRLAAAGFGSDQQLCVVSAVVSGDGGGLAVAVLDEVLSGHYLVAEVDGEAFGIVADGPDLVEGIRSGAHALEPGLGACRLEVGVSGPAPGTRLRASVEEARYARGVAAHRGARSAVVAGTELASHQLLFGAVPDELRRSFCARLLGEVRAYDETHHSELVDTLRVFLDCSGSWTQAAARLHLHVNTLRYRVGRIEELTGRDLTRFADRVDLYLALELS